MEPDRTVTDDGRSTPTVHRIEFPVDFDPGHVAAYLIADEEPILIDAGDPSDEGTRRLTNALATLGYELADVAHVVCTHPHVDHVGLVPELLAGGDPTLYAPASCRETLEQPPADLAADYERAAKRAGLPESMADAVASGMVDRHEQLSELLSPSTVDVWYESADVLEVGDRTVETIHTPGHQRDHCCLLTDLDGVRSLFAGDVAIRTFRSVAVHAWLTAEQADAITAYYGTLDRLATCEVDRVFPGHGPVHGELEEALATSRESLDRLLERTERAVRPSGTHAGHAAKARGGEDLDGPWLPEAIAALAYLEQAGRLESTVDEGVRYYTPA